MKFYIIALTIILSACASSNKSKVDTTAGTNTNKASTGADSKDAKETVSKKSGKIMKSLTGESTNIVCQYGDIKREIKLIRGENGCTVEYVKDGATQEIASGSVNSNFCTEIAERVKNNLTTAGYDCK